MRGEGTSVASEDEDEAVWCARTARRAGPQWADDDLATARGHWRRRYRYIRLPRH